MTQIEFDSSPSSINDNTFAAIDLGSNSFHMLLAEPLGDTIRPLDSLRVPVRLGAGLDKNRNITADAEKRALDALKLFAERLRDVPSHQVRVVGTNTLRRARNTAPFMSQAHDILGHPIEIISGREEARMIYSAVAHTRPDPDARRLVMDIGGGSTELVVGQGLNPEVMESVSIGCVTHTTRYIDNHKQLDVAVLQNATLKAQLELQPIADQYIGSGWTRAIGCSGTFKATGEILAELGLSDGSITRKAVRQLQKRLGEEGSIDKLKLQSVNRERQQVIVGGICIIRALMRTLKIDVIEPSQAALREGLIFEMIGKVDHVNLQLQTIELMSSRYLIDLAHVERVALTATRLFERARKVWKLDPERDGTLLDFAVRLHEVGLGISHTQYHKHGAYIIANSDLFGFTLAEQRALALLVRFHRRKIDADAYKVLPIQQQNRLLALTSLLRLSVLLNRAHHSDDFSELEFEFEPERIRASIPQGWRTEHPLSAMELEGETSRLKQVGIDLCLSER